MLIDIPFRYIFGRDLFISYSRGDSRRYAPSLALALQKRMPKLSVYLDRWSAPPSGKLPLSLRMQLRWSSILVVVCTENAVGSNFVKDEVAHFAKLRRKVVTVDVGGVYNKVRGQSPWLEVSGADPEDESREAVKDGKPSENVIERILKSVEFTTQDRRLRRAIWMTLAFVALSVGGAILYSRSTVKAADAKAAEAESRAVKADERARAADEKAATAEGKAASAEQRESAANQREAEAKEREAAAIKAEAIAEGRAVEASRKATIAEGLRVEAETKAGEARVEAQKQQTIAVARRLAAESNLAEDPHLEQMEKKVLLTIESMRRSPSAVAYRNLIEGIKMMPHPHETVSHDGKVNALTFSPDGKLMATAVGNVLWLRDTTKLRGSGDGKLGEPQKIQHVGNILRVEFSPDGNYLATLTRDVGVRIWRLEGMQELPPIPHKGALAVAFSRDASRLVVGGEGSGAYSTELRKTASVWELGTTPREVATVETKSAVLDVSFDAEGKLFTTLNEDYGGRVNFWNAAGGHQREPAAAPVKAAGDAIRGGFSPSGKHVAIVHQADRKGAQVWNAKTGKLLHTGHHLEFIQFSPDGRFLVTAAADDESDHRRTNILDVTGEPFQEIRHINYRSIIREGAFSRDGKYLALVSLEQESVQVWDTLIGRVVAYIKLKERSPQVAFTADGRFLALSAGGDVTLWPMAADWKSSEIKHAGRVTALSPDGKLIAAADDSTVQLLDAKDGHKLSSIETGCDVSAIAFDWKGERVATAGYKCGIWVWQVGESKAGTPVQLKGESKLAIVNALAFSKDGRFLAVSDDRAHVIEIANPSNHTRFGDTEDVQSVAFSPDGERVVAANKDGLDIWDRRTPGVKPKHLTYHLLMQDSNEPVVSFSEDGYLVVADDYTAHIWDISGEPSEIGTIELQDVSASSIYHSMLSPNGAFVATTHLTYSGQGGSASKTTVWQLHPSAIMSNACGRLSRPLTKSEWETAFGKELYRETCAEQSALSGGERQ